MACARSVCVGAQPPPTLRSRAPHTPIASDNGNYFVPNADALLFTFEHAFTYKDIESTRNIKATVMDHNERVFKEFARGESVKMSVAEWLTAAGGISPCKFREF